MATTICITRDKGHHAVAFEVKGHSGYADAGEDIVCAAVSAITQTAALGLSEVLKLNIELQIADGHLTCILPMIEKESLREQADVIVNTMQAGLQNLVKEYSSYIKILTREV